MQELIPVVGVAVELRLSVLLLSSFRKLLIFFFLFVQFHLINFWVLHKSTSQFSDARVTTFIFIVITVNTCGGSSQCFCQEFFFFFFLRVDIF